MIKTHRNVIRVLLISFWFLIGSATAAVADAVYTYTGREFTQFHGAYTCKNGIGECDLSGSFTVSQPLLPNLYLFNINPWDTAMTFEDGVNTIGPDHFLWYNTEVLIDTDAAGRISRWNISLASQIAPNLVTIFMSTGPSYGASDSSVETHNSPWDYFNYAYNSTPGKWSSTTTPEPATLLLLSTGLLGIVGAARKSMSHIFSL